MSIGELARATGISTDTLRYYERIGLLELPGRAKGSYRRFRPEAIGRVRFIRRASRLGFSLAEVGELLRLRDREGTPCGPVRETARQRLTIIEAELAELQELRDAVAALVETCPGHEVTEDCQILERLGASEETFEPGARSWTRTAKTKKPSTHTSHASKRVKSASKTV